MTLAQLQKISRELLDLLDRQVETILGRNFNDLSQEERDAYEARKSRIIELHAALKDIQKLQ